MIPARLAATRLPNKPLADIAGAPMIVHVWRRAVAAGFWPVVVACGDREIAESSEARRNLRLWQAGNLTHGRGAVVEQQLPLGALDFQRSPFLV